MNHSEVIVARADKLGDLGEGQTIGEFFFELSAATASEMRIQRAYEPDREKANEQAGYIEKLKWDVVAQAFETYLKEKGFDFVLQLGSGTPLPEHAQFSFNDLPAAEMNLPAEDWQISLYFLVHLVPVADIGKLLHQIRKWNILAGKGGLTESERADDTAAKLNTVFGLYLDMHDAKFEGGAALTGCDRFSSIFESERAFNTVFPAHGSGDDRTPKRGLREIMRFGHFSSLRDIFEQNHVTENDINAL